MPADESNLTNVDDPILKAIAKYKNHPSILRIKNHMKGKELPFLSNSLIKRKLQRKYINHTKERHVRKMVIPVELVKSIKNIFSLYIAISITQCPVVIFSQIKKQQIFCQHIKDIKIRC